MKLNERSLAFYATCDSPADNSGFLYKKGERHTAYHRRWFVLKGNMLFYFEERDSREPVGVIILEGCTVELCEAAEEFAFAIRFAGARSRTYVLAADSQPAMEAWVKALSRASFDYMRLVVRALEQQLEQMRSGPGGRPRAEPLAPPRRERSLPAAGPRENGCAVWSHEGPGLPNGSLPRTGPPPVPPRRKPSSGPGPAPLLVPETPFSPGANTFSRLHDWYGQEILALRREWQESRGQP
ncbi:sesquipedalian-1 [Gracilinanus agilis]|uniref:sesquipedalian-1 n=1 Tax=Gracilinanus agilis TaxID=191870 RepID=UPI001CFE54A8|nr:sesquipedalian-1 [Gracilinanus agilis]